MNRRAFLAGLSATAAGLLIPEKKIWALDRTMISPGSDDWIIEFPMVDAGIISYTKTLRDIMVLTPVDDVLWGVLTERQFMDALRTTYGITWEWANEQPV